MSEDGVYQSSVPSFLWMSSSKRPVPDPIFGRGCPLQHVGGPLCVPSDLKLVDRNSESYPKFEVSMS